MNYLKVVIISLGVAIMSSCSENDQPTAPVLPENISDYLNFIPSTPQRTGDPSIGETYLLNGNYVESGVPTSVFWSSIGQTLESNNYLQRSGINEDIPYDYTASVHPNGTEVVSPNCFQCHAGFIDDQFILGLGNTSYDFTIDQGANGELLNVFVAQVYGLDSPEYEAYEPFSEALAVTEGKLTTEVVGANPADKLALILAAHRNKEDLTWQDEPGLFIPDELIPADPPAWWLLKKKNAMFTTGIGRGDFSRLMMASSLLTLKDSTRAREIDAEFSNVQAFIESIEAPIYPRNINEEARNRGEILFLDHCSVCHGTPSNYPNYLVDFEILKTDSLLALTNYAYDDFLAWYNESWFNKVPNSASLVPGNGYVAPPLDGVWATAPYLHNGSVPTLWDLLNSGDRPTYWRRTFDSNDFDHEKIGWNYTTPPTKQDKRTYDATLRGYGNQGHDFGDHLSDSERWDLIEYLKSL